MRNIQCDAHQSWRFTILHGACYLPIQIQEHDEGGVWTSHFLWLNKSTLDLRIVQIFDSNVPKRTINFHWNNPLRYFSFTASRDWYYRQRFFLMGLRSVTTDFGDGTTMHCWVPKTHHPCKPALVLVHGFGANAMWQFGDHIRSFTPHFNVYVPDLLFFGGSFSSKPERTEKFQAQCLMRLLKALGIDRMMLVGISYGGFVGYSLAAQFPEAVDRLVLCCTGVCLEENDLKHGLFKVSTLEEATSILVPQTPDKLRLLMRMSFVKPAMIAPSFFLQDFINVMCTKYAEQKKELIESLLKDRQLSAVPKITQPTLVVWGELDQVFPLELGYRLKEYIGDGAQIAVIENAGHAVNLEKPREFERHLHSFLIDTD